MVLFHLFYGKQSEGEALGCQHFLRDLANVNEWKIMIDHSINCCKLTCMGWASAFHLSQWNVTTLCGVFRDCSYRDNGNYPEVETGCHWYYTCSYGMFERHQHCPADELFHGICES